MRPEPWRSPHAPTKSTSTKWLTCAEVQTSYVALLELLEAHFTHHPYLLGGHPSNADYSLMGALHAHMGRDPVPLRVLQDHAPRVFRWVEHMLMPEVESPEFFDTAVEYPADDTIPAWSPVP